MSRGGKPLASDGAQGTLLTLDLTAMAPAHGPIDIRKALRQALGAQASLGGQFDPQRVAGRLRLDLDVPALGPLVAAAIPDQPPDRRSTARSTSGLTSRSARERERSALVTLKGLFIMTETIFISHAGADWPAVSDVAQRLASWKVRVVVDRDELDLGDSFIQFMENSLASADYCLLLWSAAASRSQWVRVEWEAAFHRTITESQRFLIVGMLESYPVPELLRPRLRVDFFPDRDHGITKLIDLLRNDRRAEEVGQRPVVSPKIEFTEDAADCPIYVSSELFGKTFPWRVELKVPAAISVEQLVCMLGLPRQIDHRGMVGLRFQYHLALGDNRLKPDIPLANQGVTENSLLWLQTEMQPFARTTPVQGKIADTVFRDGSGGRIAAERELFARISQLGLGP